MNSCNKLTAGIYYIISEKLEQISTESPIFPKLPPTISILSMTFSSYPWLFIKDPPDYKIRDNLKNQTQKYFSFKTAFTSNKIKKYGRNTMQSRNYSLIHKQKLFLWILSQNSRAFQDIFKKMLKGGSSFPLY